MARCSQSAKCVEIKLSKLSCPFTWELSEIVTRLYNFSGCDSESSDIIDDSIPITSLIYLLLKCYENVLSTDADTAGKKLEAAEKVLKEIQQSDESRNIIRSIEHIVYATKCHYLYETHNEADLENILQDIVDVSHFTPEEQGALHGCKSVAFHYYYDFGLDKAIDAATKAIEKNGNNPLWHFVIGVALRRKRRQITVNSSPSELEQKHFETAFEISKIPTYGIYFAQMKRECQYGKYRHGTNYDQNNLDRILMDAYKVILDSDTKNWKVLLKTALGYMKIYTSDQTIQAEKCLDIVDKIYPDNPASFHYRGLIYQRREDWKMAFKFFKKAIDLNNYVAEVNYMECGWKIGCVDPLEHLLTLEAKYSDMVKERRQEVLLHIATSYYILRKDVNNAAKFYLMAINVDPDSPKLSSYYRFLNFWQKFGIYNFLQRQFLPRIRRSELEVTTLDVIDQLHQSCQKHLNKNTVGIVKQLGNVQI